MKSTYAGCHPTTCDEGCVRNALNAANLVRPMFHCTGRHERDSGGRRPCNASWKVRLPRQLLLLLQQRPSCMPPLHVAVVAAGFGAAAWRSGI